MTFVVAWVRTLTARVGTGGLPRRTIRTSWKWVAFGLLVVLLVVGSVSCRTVQPATSTTTEYKPTLLPVPQGTGSDPAGYQWGYVDTAGNWVIQPRFENAGFFVEGLAPVKVAGKWGYIDETGSIVIERQFTEAYHFRDGLARVATGPPSDPKDHLETASGYGFIDKTGRMVIPATWDAAGDFSEGLAAVMSGSACGFIDKNGELAIPLKFDAVGPFSEGLAQASLDGKCGYIDTKGKWKISPRFEGSLPVSAVLQDYHTHLLGGRFKSGLAPVYIEGGVVGGGACQYIDQTGEKAFPQVFQRGGEFSEGLAPVSVDDKWGFIDTSGRVVIEPQYDYPSGLRAPEFYLFVTHGFHDGLAPAALDHKVGYIDKIGTFVVAPQYTSGSGFIGGFAYVYTEAAPVPYGVIDLTGRLVYRTSPGSGSLAPTTIAPVVVGSVTEVQAVVGSWTTEYMEGRMDLTLLADGTYQEHIYGLQIGDPPPGEAHHSGTWSIENGTVTLEDCLWAVPEMGNTESFRWVFWVVESWKLKADFVPSDPNSKASVLVTEEGERFQRADGS